jgi:hypothetical protein
MVKIDPRAAPIRCRVSMVGLNFPASRRDRYSGDSPERRATSD